MFEDFNLNEYDKEDELFNLKLTHRKRSTEKKVASMDKILDDMRRVKNDTKHCLDQDLTSTLSILEMKPNEENMKDENKRINQFPVVYESQTAVSVPAETHNLNKMNLKSAENGHEDSLDNIVKNLMLDLLNTYFSY